MTLNKVVFKMLCCFLCAAALGAEEKRPITPADCVTVRDIQSVDRTSSWRWRIKISPDGANVAYLLESPNLATNINDTELYIRPTSQEGSTIERPLMVGDITDFAWFRGGHSLAILVRENGRAVIDSIEIRTGRKTLLARAETDIDEFSIDQNGDTIAYTLRRDPGLQEDAPTAIETAQGYRIPFARSAEKHWPRSLVYVTKFIHAKWSAPRLLEFTSPIDGRQMTSLTRAGNSPIEPTLSPDGSKLLVTYEDLTTDLSKDWENSSHKKYMETDPGAIPGFEVVVMYRFKTGQTEVPIRSSGVQGAPLWSPDSKFFVITGEPEVGTADEEEEQKEGMVGSLQSERLFAVDTEVNKVTIVSPYLTWPPEGALCIAEDGDVFARVQRATTLNEITRFSLQGDRWIQTGSIKVPLPLAVSPIAVSEELVMGSFNDLTTPPELFSYRLKSRSLSIFDKLNPQFDHLTLAKPTQVHWQTSRGFNASGILLLPVGYVPGKRYPLVIQTKDFSTSFVCGFGNYPSFAPQPMASDGIMYLGPGVLPGHEDSGLEQKIADYVPKGYPAGLAEPAFAMDAWDSAVTSLSKQGLVDESNVGIIGFSRTGWITEFILANSKIRYRAATVADNIQFSLGEYWMSRNASTMKELENAFGGPPYGSTLKNWIHYSISFNLDKIHTPLLMEEMGYGISKTLNPMAPPITLSESFEVFSGLNRLNKPVELYFYPNEDHTPQHPQARLATMQRNVDWYRFWLQGYERPSPEDPDQYKRWEKMRDMQPAAEKSYGEMGTRPGRVDGKGYSN